MRQKKLSWQCAVIYLLAPLSLKRISTFTTHAVSVLAVWVLTLEQVSKGTEEWNIIHICIMSRHLGTEWKLSSSMVH